jgi:RNA polymerase subunit RPABC4/transcription elongation factor Spt4
MLLYQKNTGRLVQNDNNNFICFSIRKIQEDWCKMIIIILFLEDDRSGITSKLALGGFF